MKSNKAWSEIKLVEKLQKNIVSQILVSWSDAKWIQTGKTCSAQQRPQTVYKI